MKVVHIIKGDVYGGSDTLSKKLFKSLDPKYDQKLLLLEKEGITPYKEFDSSILFRIKLKKEIIFVNLYNHFMELIKADIIHIHHIKSWVLLFPFILFKKKIISSFHINFGSDIKKNFFEKIIISLIISYSTIFSKKLIFLTKGQKNNIRKYSLFKKTLDNKYKIIPNFIDKNLILKNKSNLNSKTLFVGRYTKIKGFFDLIEVAKSIPILRFNLIGDRLYKSKSNNIYNVGEVENSNIHKEYDKNSILILPSYTEAFPMVILEAMARGLVILVSDLPGMREIIKNGRNGYLFKPGDINRIKDILLYLKNNPKDVKRISNNNLKDISNFTAEKQIKKYLEVYKEVINDTKR